MASLAGLAKVRSLGGLVDVAKVRTLEDFWRMMADEIKDRAKERAAEVREKTTEKYHEDVQSYVGQAYYQAGQQALTGKTGEERITAPELYDIPGMRGHADIDSAGLVTFHLPGTTIAVDNAGTVTFGVPHTEFQVSQNGQILLNYYQVSQQAIAQHAVDLIFHAWDSYINYEHFMKGWDLASDLIKTIITGYYEASSAHGAEYYANARALEGFRPITIPGAILDDEQLDKVTQAMGPGSFFSHLNNDNDAQAAGVMARDDLGGASARLVMNGGRATVTNAAVNDTFSEGWERVIEPKSCAFCAMLAGRGAVYKESTVDFRAHDRCHCVARPVFRGQTSVNTGLSDEWAKATNGKKGSAAIAAWDQYWSDKNVESINSNPQEPTEARAGNAALAGQR